MKVLDLFSGICGFSLGLERAGMETVAFCEIDKHCQKVLKKHWPNVPILEDVTKLKGKNLEGIDLICGGFPCQDISVAGKQRGINASRSGLWKEFHRIIKEVSPRWVIIENVANLRNQGLARVLKDLWKIGYDAEWHIISARSVGACHLRERIWVIAYPNGERIQRSGVSRGSEEKLSHAINNGSDWNLTNPNMPRLWRAFASEKEKSEWWTKTTSCLSPLHREIYGVEPTIYRDVDGLSNRLDERARKERIKQLGNSIVPQIAELLGKEIVEYERRNISHSD